MSAKTSLSRQLDKIKAPQTDQFKERRGKHSFLYDYKEASSIELDAHFSIGLSGFESLCQINQSLSCFSESLFSESSKSVERPSLSNEENENLNSEIEAFCYKAISPYFLLNCTHKALEWLINRFRINEYNTDDFIYAILPYHETRFFVRGLQTCPTIAKRSSKWYWLKQIQRSGTPLPKQVLIQHCISDLGFLTSLCDTLSKSLRYESNAYITFLTCILIGIIDRCNLNENVIPIILTSILKGIKSKYDSYTRSAYCLFSYLCTSVQLERKVCEKILKRMTKKYKPQLEEEFLQTLIVVSNCQDIESLPDKMVEYIDIDKCHDFARLQSANKLTQLIISGLIMRCEDDEMLNKLIKLISTFDLNRIQIQTCINLINGLVENSDDLKFYSQVGKVLNLLERRYPEDFDYAIVTSGSNRLIFNLLADSSNNSYTNDFLYPSLLFRMLNTEDTIRQTSLIHITENIDLIIAKKDECILNFLKQAFVNIFKDNNPELSLLIISLNEKLKGIFTNEELIFNCKMLLSKCIANKQDDVSWYQLKNSTLITFCKIIDHQDKNIYLSTIFPFLFPFNEADLNTLAIILESKQSNSFSFLKDLWRKTKDKIDSSENHMKIAQIICDNLALFMKDNLNFVDILLEENVFKMHLFGLLILVKMISLSKDETFLNDIGHRLILFIEKIILQKRIKKTHDLINDFSQLLEQSLNNLEKTRFNRIIISYSLKALTEKLVKLNTFDWMQRNNCLISLFKFLITKSVKQKLFRSHLANFVKETFKLENVNFYSSLWMSEDETLQKASLIVSSHFVKKLCPFNSLRILSLLLALKSSSAEVRDLAGDVFNKIANQSSDRFVKYCSSHLESFKNDKNQISIVIGDWLNNKNKSGTNHCLISSKVIKKEWINWINDNSLSIKLKLNIILLMNNIHDEEIACKCIEKLSLFLETEKDNDNQLLIVEAIACHFNNSKLYSSSLFNQDFIFPLIINCLKTKQASDFTSKVINQQFFNSLESYELKYEIINQLLVLLQDNKEGVKKLLKKLLTDGKLFALVIEKLILEQDSLNSVKDPSSQNWKLLILILELMQSTKKFDNFDHVLRSSFELLKMTFSFDIKSSFEYLRQLILSLMINCVSQFKNGYTNCFQLEAIFECLRESRQRETQRLALNLLNNVALDFKNEILHNMMAIFTFIGTNIIHCDNQYTMEIIFETIEFILTKLITNNDENIINSLIEVLITALPDIPTHRRLAIFQRLTMVLQKRVKLSTIVSKLITSPAAKASKISKQSLISLSVAIHVTNEMNIQFGSLNDLLDNLLKDFTTDKQIHLRRQFSFSDNIKRIEKENMANFVLKLVSNEDFVNLVARQDWKDIQVCFEAFINKLMNLIEQFIICGNDENFKEFSNYYKRLNNIFYQILLKINFLLPNTQLIQLISSLIKNNSRIIQRKALEMLNDKLVHLTASKLQISQLNNIITPLNNIILKVESSGSNQEVIYNSQLALISYKLLAKHFAQTSVEQQDLLLPIITILIQMLESSKLRLLVTFNASCLLCLSQLLVSLGNKGISYMPSVMAIFINLFSSTEEVVVLANITALSKISSNFSFMMSPYLDQIILKVCKTKTMNFKNSAIQSKLNIICINLSKQIPTRIMVKYIDSTCRTILNSLEILCEVLNLLKMSIENIKKDETKSVLNVLRSLLLDLLDLRNKNESNDLVENTENSCISMVTVFMTKLVEHEFRPLFYKLYDWAVRENEGTLYKRILTFYKLTNSLINNLKELFCVYAAPTIVHNCVQLLNQCSSKDNKETNINDNFKHELSCSILSTLSKCFLYDNGSFLNNERVEALTSSIINQLEFITSNEEEYEQRAEIICSCIKNLLHSFSDDTILKNINYQVLLRTRDDSPKVRLYALKALQLIILESNEEYLPLLPETMQFIAELNEDDSNEVEKLVHVIVDDLEQILGEPISKYL